MKNFTLADVQNGQYIYLGKYAEELIDSPLWWHKQGLSQTASGYGGKLTSRYKILFEGKQYRLYATCFSNAGSAWFTAKGKKYFVS